MLERIRSPSRSLSLGARLDLFGEEVTRIVEGCTDSWEKPKRAWRERKEVHIAHLRQAPAKVLRVSAADKLHNARSILVDLRVNGDTLWTRFRGGKEGTLWYYRTMGALLQETFPGPLVDELLRVVGEMERLAAGDGGKP